MAKRNNAWTRDELILALDLYGRVSPLHRARSILRSSPSAPNSTSLACTRKCTITSTFAIQMVST